MKSMTKKTKDLLIVDFVTSLFNRWGLAVVAALAVGASPGRADFHEGEVAPPVAAKEWLNIKPDEQPTAERLKGKVVMVEFWGTWCGPCVRAMPRVQQLWDRYRDRGLVVLAVSYEKTDLLKAFLDKKGYTMPCGSDPDKTCIAAYAFKGWPHTFVIGQDGKLAFVGDPFQVEPAIEKALGLEATPTSLLAQYLGAVGGPSRGREILERLVEKAPTDFDLKQWAKETGGRAHAKSALNIEGAKHFTEYVKLCGEVNPDAAKKLVELDWLAAGGPEKFDLCAWAREGVARNFPLTTEELVKLLDDNRLDAVIDAILDRNPSPEVLDTAAKFCIPFTTFLTQHAADARLNAKRGLMASLWAFAKKIPKDNNTFWEEMNVNMIFFQDNDNRALTALMIDGQLVTAVGATTYTDRQLSRFLVMDSLKDGKKPELGTLRADVAKERDALTKELRTKYDWVYRLNGLLLQENGVPDKIEPGKITALYMSAKWCGPCRGFTPELVKFRNQNADHFQFVFVSFDKSKAQQLQYMVEDEMNTPSIPFDLKEKDQLIADKANEGIPQLLVYSPQGTLITRNGRELIQSGQDSSDIGNTNVYGFKQWKSMLEPWIKAKNKLKSDQELAKAYLGAKPVYALLGVPDHLGISFRSGGHLLAAEDWDAILDFADLHLRQRPIERSFDVLPASDKLH